MEGAERVGPRGFEVERGKTTVRGKAQSGSVVLPFVRLDTPTALSSADDYVLLLVASV